MNRDGGGKPRRQSVRGGRQLTEEEVELWHQLGRSLDKVKKKPRVTGDSDIATPENPVPVGRQAGVGRRASQEASPRPAPDPRHPTPDARLAGGRPAAPAEIDRRTHRQVAAGKVPIDAVLDLHGLNQEVAHSRLRRFLMSCQAKGHRMVLVVTGKGAKAARSDDWPIDGSQRGGAAPQRPAVAGRPGVACHRRQLRRSRRAARRGGRPIYSLAQGSGRLRTSRGAQFWTGRKNT